MKKRIFSVVLICIFCLAFICGCNGSENEKPEKNPLKYYEHTYEKFNELSEPIFKAPGCEQAIAPQSISVWEEKDLAFIGGYLVDHKGQQDPTLFIVDIKSGEMVGSYKIYNVNNSQHYSYIGGLAVTPKNLFMSCKNKLFRMPLDQFSTPVIDGSAQIVEEIKTPANSALCSYAQGKLWVGDFYVKGNSSLRKLPSDRPIPKGLNLQGKAYSEPQPCVFGYQLTDTESEIQWDSETEGMGATPDYCIIIQEKIRGFTLYNNYAVISNSFGSENAIVYFKKCDLEKDQPNATTTINGKEVPTWDRGTQFNKSTKEGLVETVKAMPEGLGITQYKGDFLLVFSSGTKIYLMDENSWKEEYATEYVWRIKFPPSLVQS